MAFDRKEGRRARGRAFQPTLDGRLEPRLLLTGGHLSGRIYLANPSLGFAYEHNNPPFIHNAPFTWNLQYPLKPHFAANTGRDGQKVRVFMDGGVWDITLSPYTPALTPGGPSAQTASTSSLSTTHVSTPGTVRAYPMGHGQVGIIVDGSNTLTDLTINLVGFPTRVGYANSFAYAYAKRPRILNVGAIDVTSGSIGAIEGFHTADLTGPITVNGPGTVDRIALNAIDPGASITVGGTLNTLDVANGITMTGNGNITTGMDLNLLNVGTSINLSGGSSIIVGRTLGEVPQPAKGTGNGSNILALNQAALTGGLANVTLPNVAAYIQGNVTIASGSTFTVTNGIGPQAIFYVAGNFTGVANLQVPNLVGPQKSYTTTTNPPTNFVVAGTTT